MIQIFQQPAKELVSLTNLQAEVRAIACSAVQHNAPAAMVLNSLDVTFKICPHLEQMLKSDYDDATTIGAFHVYLRRQSRAAD